MALTKVEETALRLEAVIAKQEDIVKEARLGLSRRKMYEQLKEVRSEINRLVQSLGTF